MFQISLAEPSEGFRISFHDHLSTGSVANTGFVMSPGLSYTIQLSNKLVSYYSLTIEFLSK